MKLKKFFTGIITITALIAVTATGCNETQKTQNTSQTSQQQKIEKTPEPSKITRIPARPRKPKDETHSEPANTTQAQQQAQTQEKIKDAEQGRPNIKFDKTEHDFGNLNPSENTSCTFNFENTGDAELVVNKRIKSTCGCTVPTLKRDKYPPGDSGVIKVKFRAPSRPGSTTKSIYVKSNDPDNPRQQLKVTANIVLAVDYNPKNLDLSLIEQNADAPPITIESLDNNEFAIVSSESTNDTITIETDPSKKAMSFTLKPKVDLQKFKINPRGNLTIRIDHPKLSRITIPYSAPVLYRVSRPNIIIKDVEPGQEVIKEDIFVVSNYGSQFKVASTESNRGYIEVIEKKKLPDGRTSMKLKITVPPKKEGKFSFNDQLKIKLDNDYNLSITCYGIYKR
jgi:hypothetical protein